MNNEERIKNLKEEQYQKIFGVKKKTFDKMLEILNNSYIKLHSKGGKKPKLSVLDKLIIMLDYYREYRSMENIAFDYGVVKSTICDSLKWVENILIKDGTFSLPKKRKLQEDNIEVEVLLVDATECEIERPKKTKKLVFRKKEKTYNKNTNTSGCKNFKNI